MAVNKPDAYQHNNPNLAFVDADFVRGGGRVVDDLTALYALSTKADQLKVRVTRVWVTSEAKYYVLVDSTKINQSAGWTIETTGGGGSGTPGVSVTNATINGLGHLIITLSDNTTIDAGVAVGPQGTAGTQGATGATGNGIASTSYNASTGVLTITYTSGGTYSTGDLRGATGATGAQGIQGLQGQKGDTGEQGAPGSDGLNAYEIYILSTTDNPPLSQEQWSSARQIKELLISKSTFNSIAEPAIYKNGSTARAITGHILTSNATDFSITISGVTYDKTATYPIALPANQELTINDVIIQTGYNVGNIILIIQ